MYSDPAKAKPVTVTDMVAPPERQSHPQFGGAAGDRSVPDLEKTRMQVAPPVGDMEDERTRVLAAGAPPGSPAAGLDLRPRLGGGAGGAPATPHSNEATRMVSMPQQPPAAPSIPGAAPSPVIAPPPTAPAAPAAPVAPPSVQVAPGAPPGAPEGFAGPPPPAAPAQEPSNFVEKILAKIQKKPAEPTDPNATQHIEAQKKQALPTRTWILLAVTVLFTVGWLLWGRRAPAGAGAPADAERRDHRRPDGRDHRGPDGRDHPTADPTGETTAEPGPGPEVPPENPETAPPPVVAPPDARAPKLRGLGRVGGG